MGNDQSRDQSQQEDFQIEREKKRSLSDFKGTRSREQDRFVQKGEQNKRFPVSQLEVQKGRSSSLQSSQISSNVIKKSGIVLAKGVSGISGFGRKLNEFQLQEIQEEERSEQEIQRFKSIIRHNKVGRGKYDELDYEKTLKEFNQAIQFSGSLLETVSSRIYSQSVFPLSCDYNLSLNQDSLEIIETILEENKNQGDENQKKLYSRANLQKNYIEQTNKIFTENFKSISFDNLKQGEQQNQNNNKNSNKINKINKMDGNLLEKIKKNNEFHLNNNIISGEQTHSSIFGSNLLEGFQILYPQQKNDKKTENENDKKNEQKNERKLEFESEKKIEKINDKKNEFETEKKNLQNIQEKQIQQEKSQKSDQKYDTELEDSSEKQEKQLKQEMLNLDQNLKQIESRKQNKKEENQFSDQKNNFSSKDQNSGQENSQNQFKSHSQKKQDIQQLKPQQQNLQDQDQFQKDQTEEDLNQDQQNFVPQFGNSSKSNKITSQTQIPPNQQKHQFQNQQQNYNQNQNQQQNFNQNQNQNQNQNYQQNYNQIQNQQQNQNQNQNYQQNQNQNSYQQQGGFSGNGSLKNSGLSQQGNSRVKIQGKNDTEQQLQKQKKYQQQQNNQSQQHLIQQGLDQGQRTERSQSNQNNQNQFERAQNDKFQSQQFQSDKSQFQGVQNQQVFQGNKGQRGQFQGGKSGSSQIYNDEILVNEVDESKIILVEMNKEKLIRRGRDVVAQRTVKIFKNLNKQQKQILVDEKLNRKNQQENKKNQQNNFERSRSKSSQMAFSKGAGTQQNDLYCSSLEKQQERLKQIEKSSRVVKKIDGNQNSNSVEDFPEKSQISKIRAGSVFCEGADLFSSHFSQGNIFVNNREILQDYNQNKIHTCDCPDEHKSYRIPQQYKGIESFYSPNNLSHYLNKREKDFGNNKKWVQEKKEYQVNEQKEAGKRNFWSRSNSSVNLGISKKLVNEKNQLQIKIQEIKIAQNNKKVKSPIQVSKQSNFSYNNHQKIFETKLAEFNQLGGSNLNEQQSKNLFEDHPIVQSRIIDENHQINQNKQNDSLEKIVERVSRIKLQNQEFKEIQESILQKIYSKIPQNNSLSPNNKNPQKQKQIPLSKKIRIAEGKNEMQLRSKIIGNQKESQIINSPQNQQNRENQEINNQKENLQQNQKLEQEKIINPEKNETLNQIFIKKTESQKDTNVEQIKNQNENIFKPPIVIENKIPNNNLNFLKQEFQFLQDMKNQLQNNQTNKNNFVDQTSRTSHLKELNF